MQVIAVTGLSGSGKSVAIRQLEDSGYYCIDNLPVDFIVPVIQSLRDRGQEKVAVSVDIRSKAAPQTALRQCQALKDLGIDVRILALTASTPALVQRLTVSNEL